MWAFCVALNTGPHGMMTYQGPRLYATPMDFNASPEFFREVSWDSSGSFAMQVATHEDRHFLMHDHVGSCGKH
jgi:hypothetical protein